MHRIQQNREYSDNIKTKSPACCCIRCCGNAFGGRPSGKTQTRRYHRHVVKQKLRLEVIAELEYMEDKIREYERVRDE